MVYVVVIQYEKGEPLIFKAYNDEAQAERLAAAIRNDFQQFNWSFLDKVYVRGVEIHQ